MEDRAWESNLPHAFIEAGLQLGYKFVDVNGQNQTGKPNYEFFCIIQPSLSCTVGFTIPQLTADRGARSSSYSAFLKNIGSRPNLKVVTFGQVQKVLIDETKQAYGIQYMKHGRLLTVFAAREIILSAGAIGSPQILMLSGVGPKEHLEQFNVNPL